MQRKGDYVAAYNYLEQSASIRPKSYKIQHAIARNYMRHANHLNNYEEAKALFNEGEKRIKMLIESREYYKEKAKPFSVNSFILEKVRFYKKFNINPQNSELSYMNNALNSITFADTYMEKAYYAFYKLLECNDKLNFLKITIDSPYYKYISSNRELTDNDLEYDSMVEDM